ncbi:MAG: M20 family metallopeptidase [Deltaproteobacteria bacterium]
MTILLLLIGFFPLTSWGNSDSFLPELTRKLIPLYQHWHQNPELSFQEEKTALRFSEELRKAQFEVTSSFGGHGVVGVLKNGKGPTLLLRTDLDALPLAEATGLEYASKAKSKTSDGTEVPVMHACGHDLHMTHMVGVAHYLQHHKTRWQGTVIMIGQPAEEKGGGARAMLKAGLFSKFPKPNYALALHVDASQAVGKVTLIPGPLTANVDTLDIKMKGRGGHGARPQDTIDPIPMASELVLTLQTLISREKDPSRAAVITVGAFNAGTKHNIIPDSATLLLTVRTFSPEVRTKILDGIKRKAKAIALAYEAPEPEIKSSEEPVPSVINDPGMVQRLKPVFSKWLEEKNILSSEPWTVGEDFSRYGLEGVPSVMFTLGTLTEARIKKYQGKGTVPSLHSAQYFPSAEESLLVGIPLMGESAIELLSSK